MAFKPKTKRLIVLMVGATAIASMFTGYFDELVALAGNVLKMAGLG